MVAPYSIDLRERIVEQSISSEFTNQEVADLNFVSISTVKRYKCLQAQHGNLEAKKPPGRPPKLEDKDLNQLEKYIEEQPDATLEFLCKILGKKTGKNVSVPTMYRAITKINISRKKKPVRPRTRP